MIGQTVSHYKILEHLGGGGMGVVYKAEDTKLKRTVALKFLPPDLTRDETAKSRFIHEARAASALQHHNICTIHEIDESQDGRLFISMDCYEGETLKDKVESGPLPVDEALSLTIGAAEGLAKAHGSGMVHRDIKPANLMVTRDGVVKILDFGLAKLAGQTKLTKTGSTLGTVSYMSPEQAGGKQADQRSDVWSLGVVLYELLAGQVPFRGDHEAAVLYGIMNSDPAPLSSLRGDLPEELHWVTDKALAKEPGERYQSSAEFLNDLLAVYKPLQSETGAPALKARPRKRKRRVGLLHPGALAGIAAVAVLVFAVLEFLPGRDQADEPFATWEVPPLVVVAPFENRTGDESLANVAALATEILSQDLAGLDLVQAISGGGPGSAGQAATGGSAGGAALSDAGGAASAQDDADIIVSGAFYLEGEDLQFQARVSEAESGMLISTLPMIRGPSAAPREAIQRVSQRVRGALAMRLDNPFRQPLPAHPPTYDAFVEFRLGRDGFDAQWSHSPGLEAIERFRNAAALDSTFIRPLLWVPAVYYFLNTLWSHAEADTALQKLAEMRTRMDDYERLFVDMLSEQARGNNQAALGMAERIEPFAPYDQLVKMFKLSYHTNLNQPGKAIEAYDEINPAKDQERRLCFAIQTRFAADAYHALGKYEEELELRKRLIEFYPNLVLLRLDEAWAYTATGDIEEIRRVLKECQSTPGGRGFLDWSLWNTCDALRAHGYREEAIQIINDYIEERGERPGDEDRPLLKGNLARLLYSAERWEESSQAFEELLLDDPDNGDYPLYLGLIAARLGDQETVDRVVVDHVEVPEIPYSYGKQFLIKASFAGLQGDLDRAILLLREAGAQGHALNHDLYHDIDLEPLHGYAPFEEMIRPK